MEKYNDLIVLNYINGLDIEGYQIEELENDSEFMMKVLDISNDKKMYYYCTDKVKKDYDFVKFIILKFRDDVDFVIEVFDYYFNNNEFGEEFDLEVIELLIIVDKILKQKKRMFKYSFLLESIYSGKRVMLELFKLQDNSEKSDMLGMGFVYFFDLYNSSEIVLNYFAKKMIEDIFQEYDIDLEKMFHSQFKTKEKINEYGINNYMVSFIEIYDSMLSSYASTHLDVLSDFKEKIKKIKNNWDCYNEKEEEERYTLMIEKVSDYMLNVDSIFTDTYLMYYIGNKLGIAEKIAQFDCVDEEIFNYIMEDLSDEFVNDTFEVSFIDRIHYKNVKNIMMNTLFSKKQENSDEQEDNRTKADSKILKFDFRKK